MTILSGSTSNLCGAIKQPTVLLESSAVFPHRLGFSHTASNCLQVGGSMFQVRLEMIAFRPLIPSVKEHEIFLQLTFNRSSQRISEVILETRQVTEYDDAILASTRSVVPANENARIEREIPLD